MPGYSGIRVTVVSRPEHPPNRSTITVSPAPPPPLPASPHFELAPSSLFDSSRERNVSRMSQGCVYRTEVFTSPSSLSPPRVPPSPPLPSLSFFPIIFLDVEQTCTVLVKFRGRALDDKGPRVRVFRKTDACGNQEAATRMTKMTRHRADADATGADELPRRCPRIPRMRGSV